jgi:periplasmic divalent cation tolerance protein
MERFFLRRKKTCCVPLRRHVLEMKSTRGFKLVFVTAPDLKVARKLATAALKARLIACANLVPRIESHYWWQGKMESNAEVLLILKTTATALAALEKLVIKLHPYDTPEIVAVDPRSATERYLKWWAENCAAIEN